MTEWTFTVPGNPAPWQVYTRQGTPGPGILRLHAWQAQIEAYAKAYWYQQGPREPIKGPVRLMMEFYLPWPASAPKLNPKAQDRWRCLHRVKRPDLRNYGKAAEDALQGIVFVNDGQVVVAGPDLKDYSTTREGYTIIHVEALTGVEIVEGTVIESD